MPRQKSPHPSDPHAEREAGKYERPIASRELLLQLLTDAGKPMTWQQLAEVLDLHHEDDIEALTRRLRAMERDGQVVRNRRNGYGPIEQMDMVRGRVVAHPDFFGFLIPDDGSEDLFLTAREMRALMHRDRVVARVSGVDRRGRREGAVVEILERNTHQVVGRFQRVGAMAFVIPDNKRITHEILIPADGEGQAEHGQIVVAEITEQPTSRRQPVGRIVEVLGEHLAPGMEIDIAMRANELPYRWPDAVEDEVAGLRIEVADADKTGREDIRELPLVTIDGEDAKDFDDAVYCEAHGRGWRLWVAIADVSHYVKVKSALDQEAVSRGNSVYFPGRVIPMLPEILSNGLCSINPQVDRLCMVCEMVISATGQLKSYRFFEGLMRSHARFTYTKVAAILAGDQALREQYHALVPHLEELHRLYRVFDGIRRERGSIEFETTETSIVFGADKKIERIVPLIRNDAHKMIEECMIAANVAAAKFLSKHKIPLLYRVHEPPKEDKLSDLRAFLSELGLNLPGGDEPQAGDFSALLETVRGRPDAHLIQTVMLRSLKQAVYSPDNKCHFGLALEEYAHFTSPIRRYPDLLVHRGIRHVLRGGSVDDFTYGHNAMQLLGENCSMTERRADDATRDAVDWLKCEYMQDKVGEVFGGVVSSVTSFGLFVELSEIYVEGLVHVTSLRSDFYHFDPARHCLRGDRTRQTFRLGDPVMVRVMRVDLDDRKIDFEMVESAADSTGKDKGGRGQAERQPAAGKAGKAGARGKKSHAKQSAPSGKADKDGQGAGKAAKGGGKSRRSRGRRR